MPQTTKLSSPLQQRKHFYVHCLTDFTKPWEISHFRNSLAFFPLGFSLICCPWILVIALPRAFNIQLCCLEVGNWTSWLISRIVKHMAIPGTPASAGLHLIDNLGFFFFFFLIGVWLLYNVVIDSAVQEGESTLCVYIPPPLEPPSHHPTHPLPLGHHRALSWAPWAIQLPSSYQLYTWWCIYMSMLLSESIPPSPSCVHKPILYICVYPCPANRFISTIFLDSIYMHYVLYFSLSDLLRYMTDSRSIHFLQMAQFSSFLWLSKYFIVYMYHIVFVCSSVNGHLGCFSCLGYCK